MQNSQYQIFLCFRKDTFVNLHSFIWLYSFKVTNWITPSMWTKFTIFTYFKKLFSKNLSVWTLCNNLFSLDNSEDILFKTTLPFFYLMDSNPCLKPKISTPWKSSINSTKGFKDSKKSDKLIMTSLLNKVIKLYKIIFNSINQKSHLKENFQKSKSPWLMFYINFTNLTFIFSPKGSKKTTNSWLHWTMPLKRSLLNMITLLQYFTNIVQCVDRWVRSPLTNKRSLCYSRKSPPKINSLLCMKLNCSRKSKTIKLSSMKNKFLSIISMKCIFFSKFRCGNELTLRLLKKIKDYKEMS